jgi:hypothetical protein
VPTRLRKSGCGKVEFVSSDDVWGLHLIYDATTEEPVGMGITSDVSFGACNARHYAYGEWFDCDSVDVCLLCPDDGRFAPTDPPLPLCDAPDAG